VDRFGYSATSLDELKQIQNEVSSTQSLQHLRSYFERVQELRRIHSGNFDVQLLVAETQEAIIERARDLRSRSGAHNEEELFEGSAAGAAGTALAIERREEYRAEGAPEGDRNWRRATVLALILTGVICAVFFFLIQAARRINLPSPETKTSNPSQPSQTATPSAKAPQAAPVATTPTVRLYTDLIPGTVSIDDGEPQDLKDGELVLDHLQAGQHSIKVSGRSGSAEFSFDVADGSAPQAAAPITANNALAVLVSTQNGKGRLLTSAQPADISLDGKPLGQATADGLTLSELGTTDHELQIAQQNDRQRFIMTYTAAPVLTVYVKSVLSLGTVTVLTKQDGASIFIQDKPYRRKTERGQIRIPLKVGAYSIRVHKDGFVDPPAKTVEVKKGEESELVFNLEAVPALANVDVQGAPPGAAVYIDGSQVATADANGRAQAGSVKAGEHSIELRLDGWTPKRFLRVFQPGSTVSLSGADTLLQKVEVEKKPVEEPAPPPPESKPSAAKAVDMPGEQVRRGGGFVHYNVPRSAGHYSFEAHSKIGGFLKHDKLQWYAGYEDSDDYVMFSVDGKHASVRRVRDGKSEEINRISFSANSEGWLQVEMTVNPESISARVRKPGGQWNNLGTVTGAGRDFTQGRVGFYLPGNDEIAVANFRFSPK
jgi:hypothetical protein